MKTIAVIVTYADRFNLLKQVVDSCLKSGISKIIIVDNNSHENSKEKLKYFAEHNKETIAVTWNNSNLGSAKAYKQGLEKAYKVEDHDFIWLLDDDNRPRDNALKTLKDFWEIRPKGVETLLSFRPDRNQYKQAVYENNPKLVLSSENSFLGFHFIEKLTKIFARRKNSNKEISFGEIAYAPYGGMFFNKSIIDEIGYPNEEYFLYSDDHDWSYRITKLNKKIYLILNSVIDDIDASWAVQNKKSSIFSKMHSAPSFRIYYNVRNRMLFEKNYLITNDSVYKFNKLLFTCILFCYSFRSKNFKVFSKAVKDAEMNNLEYFE
jgi:GT2 family glycosyltransferase